MFTKKQHIVRKTLIVASSFVMGATLTLFAASAYDASVQTRAAKIFSAIESNAANMNPTDSTAYYNLVRMNIKSLIEVLSLVENNISQELTDQAALTSTASTTTPVVVNTESVSVIPVSSPKTNTGLASPAQSTIVSDNISGWSRVDGTKSVFPKTPEDLKMICKTGYRLPTNAEWEKLRAPNEGDNFTSLGKSLSLSSAYYWTQEGDLFYSYGNNGGYLIAVKPEEKDRIRSIPHDTRCIATNGVTISSSNTTTPGTTTTPVVANTGSVSASSGTSPKTNTGLASPAQSTIVSDNISGWSRVDGTKSVFPKSSEDLKTICKTGYRLPTNAEWENLRAPNEGDNFTPLGKSLSLSSVYYWTQEGDLFYSYGNNGGYLIAVKPEEKDRIRNIPHDTRCIATDNKTGASTGAITTVAVPGNTTGTTPGTTPAVGSDIFNNLGQFVGKELISPSFVEQNIQQYQNLVTYAQIRNTLKDIEKKTTSNVITKVEDLGNKINVGASNRLLDTWYGFGHSASQTADVFGRAVMTLNTHYTTPANATDGVIASNADQAYGAVERLKSELYIMAASLCPEGSEVAATWQYLSYGDTTKQRSNICKVKGQEKYFKVYFASLPAAEKITQKYTGIAVVNLDNPKSSDSVCKDSQDVYVFGKKVIGTFQNAIYEFDADGNSADWRNPVWKTGWGFSYTTYMKRRQGECFETPYSGLMEWTGGGYRAIDSREKEFGICPGMRILKDNSMGGGSNDYLIKNIKQITCNYNYIVTP